MIFSVTILGSNSAIPTLQRNPSAHLLNANERLFLIDCAEGTQLQLRRYKIHFQRIKHVLISHLHGDHFYGLIGFLTSLHLLGRKEELHLYANPDLQQIIDIQLAASKTSLIYPLIFHPLVPDHKELIIDLERLKVFSFPLLHSVPTNGFLFVEQHASTLRIRPARSYAYCSDTAYSEDIVPYIKGVDLLYHEATFLNEMVKSAHEKFHCTAREAATIASRANVKKLLIGHFSARYDDLQPLLDEAKAIFPSTELAEDGKKFDICR
ncbi:MAG: ribonuclease Z [Bacteroidetes bacterium]|nr:ribonuclease Z [Bacteroidota bacterium]